MRLPALAAVLFRLAGEKPKRTTLGPGASVRQRMTTLFVVPHCKYRPRTITGSGFARGMIGSLGVFGDLALPAVLVEVPCARAEAARFVRLASVGVAVMVFVEVTLLAFGGPQSFAADRATTAKPAQQNAVVRVMPSLRDLQQFRRRPGIFPLGGFFA